MNLERLLGSLVGDALGARPKKSARALDLFTGRGKSSWLSASKLLTAAALGWGAYEIYRTHKTAQPSSTTTVVPGASGGTPPPLPTSATVTTTVEAGLDPLRRIVATLVAAARCDGELGEEEYARIVAHAREQGAETLVREELERRRTVEEIANGVPRGEASRELYQLAFGVVRADEDVQGAERVWLARLSNALGLTPSETAQLEREITTKLDDNRGTKA